MFVHRLSYYTASYYFTRILGLIYAIAFISWGVQSEGLVGAEGILPARQLIKSIEDYEAKNEVWLFHLYPTIFRLGSLVDWIVPACVVGAFLGVLVMLGVAPGVPLFICWVLYLSVVVVGEVFMNYQWDAFLLEVGLTALFFVPWLGGNGFLRLFPSPYFHPSPVARFLLYWLIFRLMFQSGIVKVFGGDAAWIDLTALIYHYETQPLPHVGSWVIHQAPFWFHAVSCVIMHLIEIVLPFGIFMGRWGRRLAGCGFIVLMGAIFFTGNYNFFNLLTAAVSLTLIDDAAWPRFLYPRALKILFRSESDYEQPIIQPPPWHHIRYIASVLFAPVAFVLTLIAADYGLAARIKNYTRMTPELLLEIHYWVSPLRSFNAYGLFQVMTRTRDEIVFEVSEDGENWYPLHAKYKPGRLEQEPRWVAPHQPRLDWQLWFAALVPDGYQWPRDARRDSPLFWFTKLCDGLLRHKEAVWRLFDKAPIEIQRVNYIRAQRYRYRMTTREVLLKEKKWWERESLGLFLPVISLRK